MAAADAKNELISGTLDLLVLKTLATTSMHGYGIAQHLQLGEAQSSFNRLFGAISRVLST